ncbi:TPA: Abi family protein [Staphylococcus aureus]|nr:Abi family protein [Staphylococcus aureus]
MKKGIKLKEEKRYTTLLKRIDTLKNERSLNIDLTNPEDRRILHSYNHYNLINAYKDNFIDNTVDYEKYLPSSTLDEFEALYKFDKNLRKIISDNILDIEETIKHLITQSFYEYFYLQCKNDSSSHYNIEKLHKEDEYLKPLYYDISNLQILRTKKILNRADIHAEFESEVRKKINKSKFKSQYLRQYTKKGYFPMWVTMNVLTLGNIVNMYDILKHDVKIKMLTRLGLITNPNDINNNTRLIQDFSDMLKLLNIFRNLCAHNERLYNFLLPKDKIVDNRFMNIHKIVPKHYNPTTTNFLKRSIFICLFIISLFKTQGERTSFIRDIKLEFKKLDKVLRTIKTSNIKFKMNLAFDWENSILKANHVNIF